MQAVKSVKNGRVEEEPDSISTSDFMSLSSRSTRSMPDSFPLIQSVSNDPLLVWNRNEIIKQEEGIPTTIIMGSGFSTLLVLAASTYALSSASLWMLYQFEWFQTWRYVWPLMGLYYAADGAFFLGGSRPFLSELSSLSVNPFMEDIHDNKNNMAAATAFAILLGVAGVGLVIGGAYDAFMPVWMTGPNVLTTAGIGQDSAMILWLLTTFSVLQKVPTLTSSSTIFWRNVVLLSQLYILSDSTFDDVISRVTDLT